MSTMQARCAMLFRKDCFASDVAIALRRAWQDEIAILEDKTFRVAQSKSKHHQH